MVNEIFKKSSEMKIKNCTMVTDGLYYNGIRPKKLQVLPTVSYVPLFFFDITEIKCWSKVLCVKFCRGSN